MDIFLMIRRKTVTLFLDTKETQNVLEVKKMIHGILKVAPADQMLLKDNTVMDDSKLLTEYNLTSQTARAQTPATLGLCLKNSETGDFEFLDITPLSTPPDLPEVMKPQENIPPANPAEQLIS